MAVVIWAPEDCLPIWAARRLKEIDELERLDRQRKWMLVGAIGLAALLVIGRLT